MIKIIKYHTFLVMIRFDFCCWQIHMISYLCIHYIKSDQKKSFIKYYGLTFVKNVIVIDLIMRTTPHFYIDLISVGIENWPEGLLAFGSITFLISISHIRKSKWSQLQSISGPTTLSLLAQPLMPVLTHCHFVCFTNLGIMSQICCCSRLATFGWMLCQCLKFHWATIGPLAVILCWYNFDTTVANHALVYQHWPNGQNDVWPTTFCQCWPPDTLLSGIISKNWNTKVM